MLHCWGELSRELARGLPGTWMRRDSLVVAAEDVDRHVGCLDTRFVTRVDPMKSTIELASADRGPDDTGRR